MMPFSVLRVWGTGLLSWLLLGAGIYCLWEWADGRETIVQRREVARSDPRDPTETTEASEQHIENEGDKQGGWPYLAAGLALLAFNFVGFVPMTLMLGKPGGFGPASGAKQGQVQTVERPDGSRLHVETFGSQNSPTLVFTHGWSLDRTAWAYATQELSDRFRVVVWDLPGLGKSTRPKRGEYTLEKLAEDLAAVIGVSGRGPIILVGHSIGGMTQQTYCRLYPEHLGTKVAGMVLLHTTYTNPVRTAFCATLLTAIEKPILVPLIYLTGWLAPLAFLSNLQSYLNGSLQTFTRLTSFGGQQTWGQLNYGAWLAVKAWPGIVSQGNLAMLAFDEQANLPQIQIPVLVIAAKHDRMTKPDASEFITQRLPLGVETTIVGGHLGFWEQHAAVAELVAEFAERHAVKDADRPAAKLVPSLSVGAGPK